MITLQQWKEFLEHRDSIIAKVHESEAWKKNEENILKMKYHSRWEVSMFSLAIARQFMEVGIPDKTVEACLDWLATRK